MMVCRGRSGINVAFTSGNDLSPPRVKAIMVAYVAGVLWVVLRRQRGVCALTMTTPVAFLCSNDGGSMSMDNEIWGCDEVLYRDIQLLVGFVNR